MIVDDYWVSIGSINFDNRSFKLNAEANLNVVDRAFALNRGKIFDLDKGHSKLITYDQWINRTLRKKISDKIYSIANSQL